MVYRLLLTTINRHEPPCTMMLSCPLSLTERSLRLRTILNPKNRDKRKPMYSIYIYSMRRLESVLEILYSLSHQLPKNATTRWFRAKSTYSTSTRSFGWPNILLVNCWSKNDSLENHVAPKHDHISGQFCYFSSPGLHQIHAGCFATSCFQLFHEDLLRVAEMQ